MFGSCFLIDKTSQKRTKSIIIIVSAFLFCIIEGCRYDRGADHLWYEEIYKNPRINEQPLFVALNSFLQSVGLDYWEACIAYALIFIIGGYSLIHAVNEKEEKCAFLFLILANLLSFECFIRQYIAIPLIFISITYVFYKKWFLALVFLVCGIQIHTASFFLFICFIVVYLLRKYIISYKISISLLLLVYFVSFADYTRYIIQLINNISPGLLPEGFEGYIANAEIWFGEDSKLDGSEQSTFAKLMQLGFDVSAIYLGYFVLKYKPNEKINIFYNLMIVGVILTRMFWGLEIIIRLTKMLYQLWFIPVGYIFYHKKYLKRIAKNNIYCLYLIILYLTLYWLRYIFLSPSNKFIWS